MKSKDELLEMAWVVIANAGAGNWARESIDWQDAAARWRNDYHAALAAHPAADAEPSLCPCCGHFYGCYCHEHPHDKPECPGRDGWSAEMQRALDFIPREFCQNDAWENGVKRMADEIARLRAAAHPAAADDDAEPVTRHQAWVNGVLAAAALIEKENPQLAAGVRLLAKFDPARAAKARQEIAEGKCRVL